MPEESAFAKMMVLVKSGVDNLLGGDLVEAGEQENQDHYRNYAEAWSATDENGR